MAYKIIWTDEAKNSFKQIIEYLNNVWDKNVINDFTINAFDFIEKLSIFPEIGEIEVKMLNI